jgi:hypothetical protein
VLWAHARGPSSGPELLIDRSSVDVNLMDYSQVDGVRVWYKSVNFKGDKATLRHFSCSGHTPEGHLVDQNSR